MTASQYDDLEGNTWFVRYRAEGRGHLATENTAPEWPVYIITMVTLGRMEGPNLHHLLDKKFLERLQEHIAEDEAAFKQDREGDR